MVLVFLAVYLFLQNWRDADPVLGSPCFDCRDICRYVFAGLLNQYPTLFGMVPAIGIVVDDAIVVLENVERIYGGRRSSTGPSDIQSHARSDRSRDCNCIGAVRCVYPCCVHGRFSGANV